MISIGSMPSRRPSRYPKGEEHPGEPVTPSWRELVLSTLRANEEAGRKPRNQTELAIIIGADKTGMGRMLKGVGGRTYRYVRQICQVLQIDPPTVENPKVAASIKEVEATEIDEAVRLLRDLSPERRKRALALLRLHLSEA